MGLDTIVNKHLKYTYDNGWRYEFWLKSEKRIVYGKYKSPLADGVGLIRRVKIDDRLAV
jgi:phenolic acid decarboxylase